jgi:hypothetical protein
VTVCFVDICGSLASDGRLMPEQGRSGHGLRVALHAQSLFDKHGFVAGSEVTVAGIQAALLAAGTVDRVAVFTPFHYSEVHDSLCVRDCRHLCGKGGELRACY